jgi:uncharacterized Tic20 family protein
MDTPPPPVNPQPQDAVAAPDAPETLTKENKTLAMVAHLLGIVGFLGPLIVWLIKKDESRFVAQESKESLNFQLTLLIAYVICGATSCLVIPAFIMLGLWVANVVLCIMAGMKANEGQAYQYPIALRLIK